MGSITRKSRKDKTDEYSDSTGFAESERKHGVDGRGVSQGGGGGWPQGDADRRVAQEDRRMHGLRVLSRQGNEGSATVNFK